MMTVRTPSLSNPSFAHHCHCVYAFIMTVIRKKYSRWPRIGTGPTVFKQFSAIRVVNSGLSWCENPCLENVGSVSIDLIVNHSILNLKMKSSLRSVLRLALNRSA